MDQGRFDQLGQEVPVVKGEEVSSHLPQFLQRGGRDLGHRDLLVLAEVKGLRFRINLQL
jgi:hypothetical protein